jgi:hypothetical protein
MKANSHTPELSHSVTSLSDLFLLESHGRVTAVPCPGLP